MRSSCSQPAPWRQARAAEPNGGTSAQAAEPAPETGPACRVLAAREEGPASALSRQGRASALSRQGRTVAEPEGVDQGNAALPGCRRLRSLGLHAGGRWLAAHALQSRQIHNLPSQSIPVQGTLMQQQISPAVLGLLLARSTPSKSSPAAWGGSHGAQGGVRAAPGRRPAAACEGRGRGARRIALGGGPARAVPPHPPPWLRPVQVCLAAFRSLLRPLWRAEVAGPAYRAEARRLWSMRAEVEATGCKLVCLVSTARAARHCRAHALRAARRAAARVPALRGQGLHSVLGRRLLPGREQGPVQVAPCTAAPTAHACRPGQGGSPACLRPRVVLRLEYQGLWCHRQVLRTGLSARAK